MVIKELIFDVRVTKTYQITVSEENGWYMPETPKELVDMVNSISNQPSRELDIFLAKALTSDTEITYYEIKEEE